ncbi:prepilin-type N-terminal cleavage/methylation domain-containing protein [Peptococcaceae bacterium]|nr:prepilin-type N-terminal cleavage/methylation domain-containing protein [Peptococcaceae bacterium]
MSPKFNIFNLIFDLRASRGGAPRRDHAGLTLLEIVIVITIMGFLAAMVVPLVGAAEHRERIERTKERLEQVRTAILGPRDAFDAQGFRVIGGYVGDMGSLPGLYKSVWCGTNGRWNWKDEEVVLATGQPLGLWVRGDQLGTRVTPSWDNWRGPYITYPTDPFPGDAEGLYDPARHDGKNSLDEFHMRQTEGKLSDAWGRALLFWRDPKTTPHNPNDDTLWIISEGPDRASDWSGGEYNPDAPANRDNLVVEITPAEWFDPNRPAKERETQRILDRIQDALLGPPDAFDPSGRRIIGGYLGDMGAWPELYDEWDGSRWTIVTGITGQPRALWTNDPGTGGTADLTGTITNGFGWRGPYLPKPWGTGADEVLRDAWGEPLQFELNTQTQTLTITSAGPDRDFATTADNITRTITKHQWTTTMTVKGKVVRISTGRPLKVNITLHHQPERKITTNVIIATGNTMAKFDLPENLIHAGQRLITATAGAITDSTTVFIGAGGTQSPVEHELILEVE